MRIRFVVGMLLLASMVSVNANAQKQEILPVDQVKSGMKCYGLTVLSGEKPEKIWLNIVGIIKHPEFSGTKLMLADMQKGMPVVAGMSGSPIYCDGKLLGALSYNFGEFPLKHGLAGITPIADMRDQKKGLGKTASGSEASRANRQFEIPFFSNSIVFGEPNSQRDTISFRPVAGGSQTPSPASSRLGVIAPGDSVTMCLSLGDVESCGTCTVTEVTDTTFSACGHPFLGEGSVQIPAYRSSIATTFKGAGSSYKLAGELLEPVGTIVNDQVFAVEGVRELLPDAMIPVRFDVSVDSDHYNYQFRVFRHKSYFPSIVQSGMRSLLNKTFSPTQVGTARLKATIYLEGHDPIQIFSSSLVKRQRMKMGFQEGYSDQWEILKNFQDTLTTVQQSEFNFKIQKVDIALDVWSGNRILAIDSMAVLNANGDPTDEMREGETLTVIIGMRNEDSSQKLARKFSFTIPTNLNLVQPGNGAIVALPVSLLIMSGNQYEEVDPKKLPKAQPDSAEDFLAAMRINQKDPSAMFAVLILPPEYLPASPQAGSLPELPNDSWKDVESLDFLRDHGDASESRVITIPLGTPMKDAVVSFKGVRQLRLMLK